jgi:hypothetical protein
MLIFISSCKSKGIESVNPLIGTWELVRIENNGAAAIIPSYKILYEFSETIVAVRSENANDSKEQKYTLERMNIVFEGQEPWSYKLSSSSDLEISIAGQIVFLKKL